MWKLIYCFLLWIRHSDVNHMFIIIMMFMFSLFCLSGDHFIQVFVVCFWCSYFKLLVLLLKLWSCLTLLSFIIYMIHVFFPAGAVPCLSQRKCFPFHTIDFLPLLCSSLFVWTVNGWWWWWSNNDDDDDDDDEVMMSKLCRTDSSGVNVLYSVRGGVDHSKTDKCPVFTINYQPVQFCHHDMILFGHDIHDLYQMPCEWEWYRPNKRYDHGHQGFRQ